MTEIVVETSKESPNKLINSLDTNTIFQFPAGAIGWKMDCIDGDEFMVLHLDDSPHINNNFNDEVYARTAKKVTINIEWE